MRRWFRVEASDMGSPRHPQMLITDAKDLARFLETQVKALREHGICVEGDGSGHLHEIRIYEMPAERPE